MNTIDRILIGCAAFLISFTVAMIVIFCIYQSVPDTLIDSVFGLLGGEIFLTFAIWWIKKKHATKTAKSNTHGKESHADKEEVVR